MPLMAMKTSLLMIMAMLSVFCKSSADPASTGAAEALFNMTTIAFDKGFTYLFGNDNFVRSTDGRSASIILDRHTGAGFISSELYDHGFFSASIKLPADYSAGVVVAFYTSNGDVYKDTHDELDFEFLGNIRDKEWRIQTNVYGNGSIPRGREERYLLPFDPTLEPHLYSILWTSDIILFYIDDIPIREVIRNDEMGGDYPSKPMAIYATIWDGSTWATENGKYKADYSYSPFVADFSDLVLQGCPVGVAQVEEYVSSKADRCAAFDEELMASDLALMTPRKRAAMRLFRQRYMTSSHCHDVKRYPVRMPECDLDPSEQSRYHEWGEAKYIRERPRIKKRVSRKPNSIDDHELDQDRRPRKEINLEPDREDAFV